MENNNEKEKELTLHDFFELRAHVIGIQKILGVRNFGLEFIGENKFVLNSKKKPFRVVDEVLKWHEKERENHIKNETDKYVQRRTEETNI
jgi:hypothetical protein